MTVDGSDKRVVADDHDRVQGNRCGDSLMHPSWSPDERWVIYNGCNGPRVASVDGRTNKALEPARAHTVALEGHLGPARSCCQGGHRQTVDRLILLPGPFTGRRLRPPPPPKPG